MAVSSPTPTGSGGRQSVPAQGPLQQRRTARFHLKAHNLLTLFLILNLVAAAGAIIFLYRAVNQIKINEFQITGYQTTVNGLRALGVKGSASRLAANLQKAQAGLAVARAAIPGTFVSLNTINYLFKVAGTTGAAVQGITIGSTAQSGGLFVTPVQVQVSARSTTALLAFVQAINQGSQLAVVQMSSLDFSPGPKNGSLTVKFYTRKGA